MISILVYKSPQIKITNKLSVAEKIVENEIKYIFTV